jgi:hypothetical protein
LAQAMTAAVACRAQRTVAEACQCAVASCQWRAVGVVERVIFRIRFHPLLEASCSSARAVRAARVRVAVICAAVVCQWLVSIRSDSLVRLNPSLIVPSLFPLPLKTTSLLWGECFFNGKKITKKKKKKKKNEKKKKNS